MSITTITICDGCRNECQGFRYEPNRPAFTLTTIHSDDTITFNETGREEYSVTFDQLIEWYEKR